LIADAEQRSLDDETRLQAAAALDALSATRSNVELNVIKSYLTASYREDGGEMQVMALETCAAVKDPRAIPWMESALNHYVETARSESRADCLADWSVSLAAARGLSRMRSYTSAPVIMRWLRYVGAQREFAKNGYVYQAADAALFVADRRQEIAAVVGSSWVEREISLRKLKRLPDYLSLLTNIEVVE
jgi:hypothetical protein